MAEGNVMLWGKLQERLKGNVDQASDAGARREVTRKMREVTGRLRKQTASARAARTGGGSSAQARKAEPARANRAGSRTRRKATAAKSARRAAGGNRKSTRSGRKSAPRTASAAYRRSVPAGYQDMQRELDARVNAAMEIRRGIEAKIDRGLAEVDAEKRVGGKRRGRR